jgi:hypothetical protein
VVEVAIPPGSQRAASKSRCISWRNPCSCLYQSRPWRRTSVSFNLVEGVVSEIHLYQLAAVLSKSSAMTAPVGIDFPCWKGTLCCLSCSGIWACLVPSQFRHSIRRRASAPATLPLPHVVRVGMCCFWFCLPLVSHCKNPIHLNPSCNRLQSLIGNKWIQFRLRGFSLPRWQFIKRPST